MQILTPPLTITLKVSSLHTHRRTADTQQMVSGLTAEQHTYAGYNSAKSSTLRPGSALRVCSQLTSIYWEITHLHLQSSYRWCRVSAQGKQKGCDQRFIQQPCVCLQTWEMVGGGSVYLSGPPGSFVLLAVKVFQAICGRSHKEKEIFSISASIA